MDDKTKVSSDTSETLVDIKNLEELINFVKNQQHNIIIERSSFFDSERPELVIVDGYLD